MNNPAAAPARYRVKLDAWQAYERGYHAGVRKEPKRIPSGMRLATALAREAWLAGHEAATCVAAEPDPFPEVTRAQKQLTQQLMRPAAQQRGSFLGADFAKEHNALFQRGFQAGRTGQRRLFGSRDPQAVKSWYDGYDSGARITAGLKQVRARVHR